MITFEERGSITIPARLVESVLGVCGSTLVQCCRESGASIALRPVLLPPIDGLDVDDEFVAEVCGPPGAVSIACQMLHDIIFEGGGEEDHPKVGMPCPCPATSPSPDASDVEEDFDIPRCYVPFVLGGRRCGEKGAGKNT